MLSWTPCQAAPRTALSGAVRDSLQIPPGDRKLAFANLSSRRYILTKSVKDTQNSRLDPNPQTAQFLVHRSQVKHFRIKAASHPFQHFVVIWVSGVLQDIQEFLI